MDSATGKRRRVAAIIPTDNFAGRGELRGVSAVAASRGWALETIDTALFGRDLAPFLPILEKADGVIVRLNAELLEKTPLSGLGVPIVGLEIRPDQAGPWAVVNLDTARLCAAAAEELLATERRAFAFVPMLRRYPWTTERGRLFLENIRAAGRETFLYEPRTEWGWLEERESLAKWLAGLPRPFGVFAGNDMLAKFALGACRSAGLDVPGDVAILGADDDEALCLTSDPPLSSVQIDFEGAGRIAAETLQSLFGRKRPARTLDLRYGIRGVARRASTRAAGPRVDQRLAAALDFIALHACDPLLGVGDVALAMCVCRRQADRIFATTGKSIREHIEEARLARVRTLLATSSRPIREISKECGFATAAYLSRVFRRRTGASMREWRANSAHQSR
ncbi:MAG: substrate-binding domain-containing protein [Kiritimatiellae bacterium]|nr:substrate-binding domain-containing protein [Kiritimatiellia bacterium]